LLFNFASNDYLNLAHDVTSCDEREGSVVQQLPSGSTASAVVAGRTPEHESLEQMLARFEQTEAALLFPSGYAANLGVLTGLVRSKDAVFCERYNHASIVDAARLCDGQLLVYRNDRLEQLKHSLLRRRGQFDQVFLVTDGVFSMDGVVAPLNELCTLAGQFDCTVVVDEAHGTGVLGAGGRGACEYHDVKDRVLVRIGTMSKAMGGLGGFAASTSNVVRLLRNTARTQFFSTALPPGLCRSMRRSLQVIETQPERRALLRDLSARIRSRCHAFGVPVMNEEPTPIVPISVPGEANVQRAAAELQDRGYLVPAIRWPTVNRGTERLRLSISTAHSPNLIDDVARQIADVLVST
jgi:8-amino-7-oxononanoate synthase